MICSCNRFSVTTFVFISAIAAFSFFYFKPCTPEVSVKLLKEQKDFSTEKSVFIKAYSFLYKDLTNVLQIKDLQKDLTKRFDTEKDLITKKDNNIFGVSVADGDKTVAFLSFSSEKNNSLRMRRCAIDPESKMEKVITKLKTFIFTKFSEIKSIATVVRKESMIEKHLLTQFGFVSSELTFDGYNPEIYTVFELKG